MIRIRRRAITYFDLEGIPLERYIQANWHIIWDFYLSNWYGFKVSPGLLTLNNNSTISLYLEDSNRQELNPDTLVRVRLSLSFGCCNADIQFVGSYGKAREFQDESKVAHLRIQRSLPCVQDAIYILMQDIPMARLRIETSNMANPHSSYFQFLFWGLYRNRKHPLYLNDATVHLQGKPRRGTC